MFVFFLAISHKSSAPGVDTKWIHCGYVVLTFTASSASAYQRLILTEQQRQQFINIEIGKIKRCSNDSLAFERIFSVWKKLLKNFKTGAHNLCLFHFLLGSHQALICVRGEKELENHQLWKDLSLSLSPLLPALVLREAGDSPVSDRRVNIASFLSSLPRWATRVQGWATIATVGNKHCQRGQQDENDNVIGGVRRMITIGRKCWPKHQSIELATHKRLLSVPTPCLLRSQLDDSQKIFAQSHSHIYHL